MYKRKDKKFQAKLCAIADRKEAEDRIEERAYKSAWHLLIAGVGVYELRNHKTKLSKVLALGLIAFHTDAALCDALGIPTTPQRMLRKLRP
jgi:hypothetical protein